MVTQLLYNIERLNMNNNYLEIMEAIASILNEMNTGISGMMTPPNNVVGRENPSASYTKEQSKHSDKKAMLNYKYKKNGKLNRKEDTLVNEDDEARKAVIDRKVQQINKNTNDLIMTKEPDIERNTLKLSAQPKNDSAIKKKIADDAKSESEKLRTQARSLYNWAKKHDEEGAVKLGTAILKNMKLQQGKKMNPETVKECYNEITALIENYIEEAYNWKQHYKGPKKYSEEVQTKVDEKREKFKKLAEMIKNARPGMSDEETRKVALNAMKSKKNFQELLKSAEDQAQENILKGNVKRVNNISNAQDAKAVNKNSELQTNYENTVKNAIDQFRTLGKDKISGN